MKFERGKDPKEAMEVGMRSRAPIVYRLLFIEDVDTLIGISSSQIVSILNVNISRRCERSAQQPTNIIISR